MTAERAVIVHRINNYLCSMADKPGLVWSLVTCKCPRCRRGHMFSEPNPWKLRSVMKMHVHCPECGQLFELEVGFWYGTAYVSYVITVLFSVLFFLAWYLTIGFSLSDDRFFWWLGINGVVLILLQPWFMRVSRALWLYFFIRYDEDYRLNPTKGFDYTTESFYVREEKPKA